MNTIRFIAAACCVAATAFAQELNWTELARRPECWPAQCSAKQTMKFDGGVTVQAGQKLAVLKVSASEVQVSTLDGRTTFAAEPNETDLLAIAQADFARLTPKQRALSYDSLIRQKEVWPYRVTLNKTFDLGGGQSVRAGDQLVLMDVQPGKLSVMSERLRMTMEVVPQATDLIAQARKLVEDQNAAPKFVTEMQRQEQANKTAQEQNKVAQEQYKFALEQNRLAEEQRKAVEEKKRSLGVIVGELEGKLVSSATGKPEPFDPKALPRYIVFYRGSSTCPITNQFTPTLIKYYQQAKPKHPDFEIVYMMTESVDDTAKFAQHMGFSWRAIEYESTGTMPTIRQPITGLLPQLIVMDRSGRILVNASQNAVPNALRQLDVLLKSSPAVPQ